ncbi:hypothetical protein Tco_0966691 [Tanacetum coccineum]
MMLILLNLHDKVIIVTLTFNTAILQQDLEQIHEDDLEAMDLKVALHSAKYKGKEFRNQDNTRKKGNNEDTSSKAMLAIDGVGFDWSDMAKKQVQTNMALMAFSDSENEVLFSEEVAVLKREVACKDYKINMLKSEFEKVKQEKEGIEFKIKKFDKASKDLNKLPKKLDLSYYGLDEFKEPEFKGYGPENSKQESNIVCDKKSDDSKENSDNSLVESVKPKNHEKPVKKSVRLSANTIKGKAQSTVRRPFQSKTTLSNKRFTHKVNIAKVQAVNTARPQAVNTARPKIVKTARPNSAVVNDVRVNQANAVNASACWVWRPTKPNSASFTLKKHNYIDARGRSNGCSRHMTGNIAYLSDFKEFDEGYVTFGGGAHGGRIFGKGTLKTNSLDFEDVYFVNELKFNLLALNNESNTEVRSFKILSLGHFNL